MGWGFTTTGRLCNRDKGKVVGRSEKKRCPSQIYCYTRLQPGTATALRSAEDDRIVGLNCAVI